MLIVQILFERSESDLDQRKSDQWEVNLRINMLRQYNSNYDLTGQLRRDYNTLRHVCVLLKNIRLSRRKNTHAVMI